VPAGTGVIDEPGTPAAMLEQHEHMEPAHRDPRAERKREPGSENSRLQSPDPGPSTRHSSVRRSIREDRRLLLANSRQRFVF
jgi:hypothetical protein